MASSLTEAPHRAAPTGLFAKLGPFLALLLCVAPNLTAVAQNATETPAEQQSAEADGGAAAPEATEPVVVVSIADLGTLFEDVNYLTKAIGQPQAGQMFSMLAGNFTKGIDPTMPIGLVVPLVNGAPQPIVLIPTADVKTVLNNLGNQTGPVDELDDGTLVLMVNANTVFIRQVGAWAVVAPQKELLDVAPADPMSVLGDAGKQYDLAVRLSVQQIPPNIRQTLIQQLQAGFDQAMQQQSEEDAQAARDAAQGTLGQLEQLIEDTKTLQIGFNIDPSAQQLAFDAMFTAVAGSDVAEMYTGQVAIPSRFAAVIRDDAAAYYHGATSISDGAIEQTKSGVNNALTMARRAIADQEDLSPAQQEEINGLIDRIAELALDSISEGKADAGAVLLTDEEKLQFVFGSFVSDGDEAAQIVKDLADKLEGKPNAPRFEFDRETYNGVTLHLAEADVPEGKDEARNVFGDTIRIHVGTGPNAVYLALGDQSLPLLKELIDSGDEDQSVNRPLTQLQVKLLPILEYVLSIESNDAVSAMVDALKRSNQPGLVTAIGESIENGQKSRLTIGEGVLQAIGAAINQSRMEQNQQF